MPPEFVNTMPFPPAVKERPILFSAPMVRALLDGTKTQTRRVVKPAGAHTVLPLIGTDNKPTGAFGWCPNANVISDHIACPYGQPGDRLWVRESFAHIYRGNAAPAARAPNDVVYMADGSTPDAYAYGSWKPSIHMPRWASRILLEVTGVRVERLQDISAADAKAEGIEGQFENGPWRNYGRDGYWFPEGKDTAPVLSYRSLWEQINGAGGWAANPWTWVLEFRRIAD